MTSELRQFLSWPLWLVSVALVALLLRTTAVEGYVVTSNSMEGTLLAGDVLVVDKLRFGGHLPFATRALPGYAEPSRLDVVVFDPPFNPGTMLVKRVMGLPSDTLQMHDRLLTINRLPVAESYLAGDMGVDQATPEMLWQRRYLAPGIDSATYYPTRNNWGPLVVPEGNYFLLGDNREASIDSRYWGFAPRAGLLGKVVGISASLGTPSDDLVLHQA